MLGLLKSCILQASCCCSHPYLFFTRNCCCSKWAKVRFWISALWIPPVSQFHTCSNNIVSNTGLTTPSASKAILEHWILLMWLASWHTDIIQQISHLIKSNDDQIFPKQVYINYSIPGLPAGWRSRSDTCYTHTHKEEIPSKLYTEKRENGVLL